MKTSTLNGKRILIVDEDPDLLEVLEEEIIASYPDLNVEKVLTFHQAVEKIIHIKYDAVILDIMSGYAFELLQLALSRHLRVGLLTTYPFFPEHPRLPTQMAVRAFLSKEKLGEVVPFLEKIMDGKIKDVFLLKRLLRKFVGIPRRKHLESGSEAQVKGDYFPWNKYVSVKPF